MSGISKDVAGIEELSPTIEAVDESINTVSEHLEPLLSCPLADLAAKVSPLQRAKLDLVSLYAVNSMFWVYLKSQGINPATHGLSKELDRVKTYLKRMKEIEDKKLAPHIDKDVSKRVMRNALWSAAHKPKPVGEGETNVATPGASGAAGAYRAPGTALKRTKPIKDRKRTKGAKKGQHEAKKKKKKATSQINS